VVNEPNRYLVARPDLSSALGPHTVQRNSAAVAEFLRYRAARRQAAQLEKDIDAQDL